MNELKATPGPYEIQEYTNYIGWSIYAPNAGCIAERWYSHTNFRMKDDLEVQMRANAQLFAASWDLYHELADALMTTYQLEQTLLARGNEQAAALYTERYKRIKKLLAKARGEQ